MYFQIIMISFVLQQYENIFYEVINAILTKNCFWLSSR